MDITARRHQDILVLDLAGRLDTATAGAAYDSTVEIAKGGAKRVLLNLDKLEYVSSAGLRVILTLAKLLQSSRGELKICHASTGVRDTLETSGFNSLIKLFDDEESAIRSLQ
jgi:anti-anti-sigma factor